ncbi:GSCOCG00011686001-RA-CDS [Cotesia congregata]|nr:GSCOCG00011686001-RA-CDS [Cotesia congregata]
MFQAKLLESSHAWLGASTSNISADYSSLLKLKAPTWTRQDLQDAIEAVVTQKMRFTQASTKYGIPKGTLYDNILGKSKRMMVLEEAGLDANEENAVLEFCCDITVSPYNRRTKKSLNAILNFVEKLRRRRDPGFIFTGLSGFRWWWAFCKKHSIVSLYFNDENDNE